MPGFRIGGGGSPADARIESRRKHRWRFTTLGPAGMRDSAIYLMSAQRPHVVTEEAVMHHDQEQVYFAGKHHWEPITLVFYDIEGGPDSSNEIWNWVLDSVNIPNATVSTPNSYKKNSTLEMTNGVGGVSESWQIFHVWPIDVNWNDLDYTNTEIQTVDVQMKYDRAVKN
jgi:hypothetical protein